MKNKLLYIVIAALVVVIAYMATCCNKQTTVKITDTVTLVKDNWDTIIKKEVVYRPKWKPVYIHDTIVDSIIIQTQRLAVLTQDSTVVKNDSTEIKVTYNIYSESPLLKLNKTLTYSIRYRTIDNIVTKQVVRQHALFLGPTLGLVSNSSFIGASAIYENKGQKLYKLGLGVTTQLKPVLNTGIYWQILK